MIKAPVVGRGLHYLAEDLSKMVQRKAEKRHKSEPGAMGVRRGKGGKRNDRSEKQIAHLPASEEFEFYLHAWSTLGN